MICDTKVNLFWILKDGIPTPVTGEESWREWFEVFNNRVIRQDEIEGCMISTIFFGVNHSQSRKPLLYETSLLLDEDENPIYRSETEKEALKIHESLIVKVKIHAKIK